MQDLLLYVTVSFIVTTLLTFYLFVKGNSYGKVLIIILLVWLVIQGLVSLTGFYTATDRMPPRLLLLVLPPLICILALVSLKAGRKFTESFSTRALLLIHLVRIPVEIVLYWLFKEGKVPELMTFEGRNLDILSGISAAILLILLQKRKLNKHVLLVWNFICLGLLVNIVSLAVLSAPFPFQEFAFEQPNVAVLYFPFIWLPCFIVPVVLFSHLLMIRRLITNKKQDVVGPHPVMYNP